MRQFLPLHLVIVTAILVFTPGCDEDRSDAQTVHGAIVKIEEETNQLKLRTDDGRDMAFFTDDRSWIKLPENRDGELADLPAGMRVTIIFYPGETKNGAERITLINPALPK